MYVRFILPRIVEATEGFRPIKYSLFPPLGLATLAGYLSPEDEVDIVDEHVERLDMEDRVPDLVGIEVYVTCAKRAYGIADEYRKRGAYVVMGGLHATACSDEAARHADTVVCGPAEEAFPRFLSDFRRGHPQKHYTSHTRSLTPFPTPRRDLIKRENYLVPNCVAISRGCPHSCDFCYKENFYAGGKSYYRATLEHAVAEVASLPGKYVYFMDDNLFADEKFALDLFREIAPLKKAWQAAATVAALKNPRLLDAAARAGAGSLFVGFETVNERSISGHGKNHNCVEDYEAVVHAVHSEGIMINASFVYGLEADDERVFAETTEWAIRMGLETATFHILTPYPGSGLFARYRAQGRILTEDWDLYDTRHCVFRHPHLTPETLERGYWKSYEDFYSWKNIFRSVCADGDFWHRMRHLAYTSSWKKMEGFWRILIALHKLPMARPLLEKVLRSS